MRTHGSAAGMLSRCAVTLALSIVFFAGGAVGPPAGGAMVGLAAQPAAAQPPVSCSSFCDGGPGFWEGVGDFFEGIGDALGGLFEGVGEWIGGIGTGGAAGSGGGLPGLDAWGDVDLDVDLSSVQPQIEEAAEAAAEHESELALELFHQELTQLEAEVRSSLAAPCNRSEWLVVDLRETLDTVEAQIDGVVGASPLGDIEDMGYAALDSFEEVQSTLNIVDFIRSELGEEVDAAVAASHEICDLAGDFDLDQFMDDPTSPWSDHVDEVLADMDQFIWEFEDAVGGFASAWWDEAIPLLHELEWQFDWLNEDVAAHQTADALTDLLFDWCDAASDAEWDFEVRIGEMLAAVDASGAQSLLAVADSVGLSSVAVDHLAGTVGQFPQAAAQGLEEVSGLVDDICALADGWWNEIEGGYLPDSGEVSDALDQLAWLVGLLDELDDDQQAFVEDLDIELGSAVVAVAAQVAHVEAVAALPSLPGDVTGDCDEHVADGSEVHARLTGDYKALQITSTQDRFLSSTTLIEEFSGNTKDLATKGDPQPGDGAEVETGFDTGTRCRTQWDRLDVLESDWSISREGHSTDESRRMIIRALDPEALDLLSNAGSLSRRKLNRLIHQLHNPSDGSAPRIQIVAAEGVLYLSDPDEVQEFLASVLQVPDDLVVPIGVEITEREFEVLHETPSSPPPDAYETVPGVYRHYGWEAEGSHEFDPLGPRASLRAGTTDGASIVLKVGPSGYSPTFYSLANIRTILVHEYHHRAQHLAFASVVVGPFGTPYRLAGDIAIDDLAMKSWFKRHLEAPTYRFQQAHPSWAHVTDTFRTRLELAGDDNFAASDATTWALPGGATMHFVDWDGDNGHQLLSPVPPPLWQVLFAPGF